MKLPIQYALSYPDRFPVAWENTNFTDIKQLSFEAPDYHKFPALHLAYDVLKRGGTAPAILNVVNEYAVYAFLKSQITFRDISGFVEKALTELPIIDHPTLQDVFDTEQSSRDFVERLVQQRS